LLRPPAHLVLAPSSISPKAWNPPKLRDDAPCDTALVAIERLAAGLGEGPEGLPLDIRAAYRPAMKAVA